MTISPKLNLYCIDNGEDFFYVAKDEESAIQMFFESWVDDEVTTREAYEARLGHPLKVSLVPDDKQMTILFEELDDEERTMTAREWIWECGEGFLSTSLY